MDSVTKALMDEFSRSNGMDILAEDKKFEHFTAHCIISSRYSDDFDTNDLVVGGGSDLNIDSFAVLVNGRLATDADFVSDILEINGYLDVEFIVVQCKTSNSFEGAAIIALGDNLAKEVFSDQQTLPANDDIKRLLSIISKIYENATKLKSNPVLRVYYATNGNWIDDDYLSAIISRKKNELIQTNLFSEVYYEPCGAKKIQDLYRDTKKSISREVIFKNLVTLPEISNVDASYLGVLPSTEFIKLITDEDGNIVKSVFIDNVRDFQGENDVNRDISQTIKEGVLDQFVLRNNGITIVSKGIKVTSSKFTLIDYQIVNGCQTSHVLFSNKELLDETLLIPIKLIHTDSEDVTQNVIKSTNKQTPVDENDLLALTKFQRDLEDYFSGINDSDKLFYERRAKQYSDKSDIERARIVSIGNQLKSFSSMFLDAPNQAGRYQGTLLKSVKDQVFRTSHKPEAYYTASLAAYKFEGLIRKLSGDDRQIRPFRYFLLLAFRYRYEVEEFSSAGNNKVAKYCTPLLEILRNNDQVKDAFDECCEIVRIALESASLPFERDSAKSRPLVDEVKKISRERKTLALSSNA